MEYWTGIMNAPLDGDWKCATCGDRYLIWGLVNGQCRCETCHTEYMMRNGDKYVTTPILMLKEEYRQPIKQVWDKYHVPISQMTDEMIDEFMEA